MGLGESGWKGFGLQVNGILSWDLFEEKVDEVKETREELARGRRNQGSSIRLSSSGFWGFALICRGTHLPCKNSRVRKSRIELVSPLIYSISKSKTLKIACHRAKLCLETRFWTSFYKTSLALLQLTLIKKFWLKRSFWNFEIHSMIDKRDNYSKPTYG